ncbi:MAG: hypothetical protein CSYNP_00052 [Syntrophus sp. SKADARSKE-3]|nr:hypothetical protein [Syntrophus sp. SKADARSKE-3]
MINIIPQKDLKTIGIYLIVALALIRFLVYPLYASVDGRKKSLAEQYENYQVKVALLERQIAERQKNEHNAKSPVSDPKVILSKYYDKNIKFPNIQADLIESLIKISEKKGMTVIDFELLEPVAGPNISEIPVLIRISGQSGAFVDVLREIERSDKVLVVKSMEINKIGAEFRFFLTLSSFRIEK